jgi:hypothetical protein
LDAIKWKNDPANRHNQHYGETPKRQPDTLLVRAEHPSDGGLSEEHAAALL